MLQPVAHREEKCEVLRREKRLLHVQHTRRILDTHTDMSINRSMHELGRIMGEGKENYETLETAKRLLDCNGERCARIHTAPSRRGD
jgi:hypothetical protein